jgi:hypothetical protein
MRLDPLELLDLGEGGYVLDLRLRLVDRSH